MHVNLNIDTTDAHEIVMWDEINGCLHHSPLRNTRTMPKIETDDGDGRVRLAFSFVDPLDTQDLCHWRGLQGRGRLG